MARAINQKKQDTQDFEGLLARHRDILFKVANTYCWCTEERADLMQDIATQLWRAWPGFDSKRRFSTWMYRIALNVSISYVRKSSVRKRHLVAMDDRQHDVAAPEHDDGAEAKQKLLASFIQRQSPLDGALLLLYLEAVPQAEIATILGLTGSNVSTKISRLKQRIRNEL